MSSIKDWRLDDLILHLGRATPTSENHTKGLAELLRRQMLQSRRPTLISVLALVVSVLSLWFTATHI
jgi:DNA primase large subunit